LEPYIHGHPESNLASQCALEIVSLFLLTIASGVEEITSPARPYYLAASANNTTAPTRTPRACTNTVFEMLALEMVEEGMVHDLAEAYTIVIPPFLHYHRLSDPPPDFMADYDPPIIPRKLINFSSAFAKREFYSRMGL